MLSSLGGKDERQDAGGTDALGSLLSSLGGSDGLSGLLSSLSGGKNDASGGLDPALLLKAGKAISQLNSKPDDRCTLLSALRPYLRQERQERVGEAIRILNLLRLAELFRGEF